MEKLLAKALYDNTAECPDELAFRKGDIITVMELNVPGSLGWWKCSLHGRQGLAPANRLHLLNPQQGEGQNIYQVPSLYRPSPSETYEPMDRIYKVPLVPQLASRGLGSSVRKQCSKPLEILASPYKVDGRGSPKAELYDVLPQTRQVSLTAESHKVPSVTSMMPKAPLIRALELESRVGVTESRVYNSRLQNNDPSYDIPMSLSADVQHRLANSGCSTLPTPRKSEWIYDVPVLPEKPAGEQGNYGTMPAKAVAKPVYDAPPQTRPALLLYDVPKPSTSQRQPLDNGSLSSAAPQDGVYDIPLGARRLEMPTCAVPPLDQQKAQLHGTNSSQRRKVPPPPLQKPVSRRNSAAAPVSAPRGAEKTCSAELEQGGCHQGDTPADSPDSSMGPMREVTLSQEEASRQLVDLQDAVCQAVPRLMLFVSSRWRCREHLARHVHEIRTAAEDIAAATARFLDFSLDVRGNAQRLTDANLQARLQRQLTILEDSGLILQQAVELLSADGWQLDSLVQDEPPQTPDQLDRFVMVARTIPEDVRRLVSILNANGKLLFRQTQKDPDLPASGSQSDAGSDEHGDKQISDSGGEDSDYVQLQTKTEFEKQQRLAEESKKSKQQTMKTAPQTVSEHCRLYFGALQRAIGTFSSSLLEGQPPEVFIDRGKLVIMVGQKLVDALRREAPENPTTNRDLLCKSTHLCALLKNLALATKEAALQFPNSVTLQAALEVARDLAQQAQHYRASLERSLSTTD